MALALRELVAVTEEATMTKRNFAGLLGALFVGSALYGACAGDITGEDCKLKCEDVRQTCQKKCSDDTCKSKCTTDLHDCSVKCDEVMVTSKPDAG
jgi:hypothetical protein